MPADKKNIIRHPELTRLTDAQLFNELSYEFDQCQNCAYRLMSVVREMGILLSAKRNLLPISLIYLHEDFILHTDRLQAIREEIEFRKI